MAVSSFQRFFLWPSGRRVGISSLLLCTYILSPQTKCGLLNTSDPPKRKSSKCDVCFVLQHLFRPSHWIPACPGNTSTRVYLRKEVEHVVTCLLWTFHARFLWFVCLQGGQWFRENDDKLWVGLYFSRRFKRKMRVTVSFFIVSLDFETLYAVTFSSLKEKKKEKKTFMCIVRIQWLMYRRLKLIYFS